MAHVFVVCRLDADIFTSSNGFAIHNLTLYIICTPYAGRTDIQDIQIRSLHTTQWVWHEAVQMALENDDLNGDLFVMNLDLHFHLKFFVNWVRELNAAFNTKEYRTSMLTFGRPFETFYLDQKHENTLEECEKHWLWLCIFQLLCSSRLTITPFVTNYERCAPLK